MRFVLPHHKGLRPAWLLRLGLFLYDHIGGRKLLPATRTLDLRSDPAGKPLKPLFTQGLRIFRLLGRRCAAGRAQRARRRRPRRRRSAPAPRWSARAATAMPGRSTSQDARRGDDRGGAGRGCWSMPPARGSTMCCRGALGQNDVHNVRLVQGSHIVVPKKFDDPRAYFFQNADGRIIFAIPYEDDFTLIGTTDQDYDGDPARGRDQRRPRSTISATRRASISPSRCGRDDIVWTYSGVRPLYDDGASKAQEATRDYVLKADGGAARRRSSTSSAARSPPTGGSPKSMLEKIEGLLGAKGGKPWTADGAAAGRRFRGDRLRRRGRQAARAPIAFLDLRLCAPAGPALRHAGARAARPGAIARPISAAASAPISTRPKFAI